MIESLDEHDQVEPPPVYVMTQLTKLGDRLPLMMANYSESDITIPKGLILAKMGEISPKETAEVEINVINKLAMQHYKAKFNDHIPTGTPEQQDIDEHQNSKNENEEFIASFPQISHEDATREQIERLHQILIRQKKAFSLNELDFGCTDLVEFEILLKDPTKVISQRPYRIDPMLVPEVQEYINKQLAAGLIRPSTSPFCSPLIAVRKKDSKLRLCIDARWINEASFKRPLYLKPMSEYLDALVGNGIFSSLDVTSSFQCIPIKENSKHITAFSFQGQHYENNRLFFGATDSTWMFILLMSKIFGDLPEKHFLCYVDDCIVLGNDIDVHLDFIELVLQKAIWAGLKFKMKKCIFWPEK